jgi:hypothetical protein
VDEAVPPPEAPPSTAGRFFFLVWGRVVQKEGADEPGRKDQGERAHGEGEHDRARSGALLDEELAGMDACGNSPGGSHAGAGKMPRSSPTFGAGVNVVTAQPKMKSAPFVASSAAPTTRLKRRTDCAAPRPLAATMEFVKNVLRAISPFKGSRDDDDAPATAGALNGLAAAAKKPAAAAPAPTRSSARQAAKAKAPAKKPTVSKASPKKAPAKKAPAKKCNRRVRTPPSSAIDARRVL